jgi:hypothetical protein
MRESVEFRIPEENAQQYFPPDDGVVLGGSVRKLELDVTDPRFQRVGDLERGFQSKGRAFYFGWIIHRRYTAAELRAAELFHCDISAVFEPAGQECGTVYDDSNSCSFCGSGAKQSSDLMLDLHRIPRGKDIAKTIADEIVVSERLADAMQRREITGVRFGRVKHSGRKPYDARPWFQLKIMSRPVRMTELTRVGIDPFDGDVKAEYRCPVGHVVGLNLLSELWISRIGWDGSDVIATHEHIGVRRGLLRPSSPVLIVPEVWRLFREMEVKGFKAEVAHFA